MTHDVVNFTQDAFHGNSEEKVRTDWIVKDWIAFEIHDRGQKKNPGVLNTPSV